MTTAVTVGVYVALTLYYVRSRPLVAFCDRHPLMLNEE
jgi:hypothetical protein